MTKQTFKVEVQFRSTRTVSVQAKDAAQAVERAAKRVERSGVKVIACRAQSADANPSN